jgi:hypothetical protein
MKRVVLFLAVAGFVTGASADILYNNGQGISPPFGLVNYPGAGYGGADASALESALLENTYGYGHQHLSGLRVADDFTVPAPGWNVDRVKFFAYQTGSTTQSTMTGVTLRIWSGTPGTGTVVFGDITTNRMTATAFSNIYESIDTALTASNRPIMQQTVAVGSTLPAGTYWLDWDTDGSLASGPWAPPMRQRGQTSFPGANAMQYVTGWLPIQDTGSLTPDGLPFVIEGTVVPEPASLLLLGLAGLLVRRR